MPQRYLTSEPAEALLSILADALDLVDFGILLLDKDLNTRFINRSFVAMWNVPPALVDVGSGFRDLLNHSAANGWYDISWPGLPAYLDKREAEVRAGSILPVLIDLADGRHIWFRCVACADGGRILTYADISRELEREASGVAVRVSAELRFKSEVLEEQGAHLATLAEAAAHSAQQAHAARLQLEHEIAERRQLEVKLRRLATTDGLTGVLNRAALLTSAQRKMEERQRTDQKTIVLMIDVDHFKDINDRFGHAGGDRALKHLVTVLSAGLRQVDLLGRLGGEEFAVVLCDTPLAAAEMVAERLRRRVAELEILHGDRLIPMTVSIGLAIELDSDRSIDQVIARADDALYRAKETGRNRVVVDQQTEAA